MDGSVESTCQMEVAGWGTVCSYSEKRVIMYSIFLPFFFFKWIFAVCLSPRYLNNGKSSWFLAAAQSASALHSPELCLDKETNILCEIHTGNYGNVRMVILSLSVFLAWHWSVFLVPETCSCSYFLPENSNSVATVEIGSAPEGQLKVGAVSMEHTGKFSLKNLICSL